MCLDDHMNLELKDKVVLITGGAGAIGAATARCILSEGGRVAVGDP